MGSSIELLQFAPDPAGILAIVKMEGIEHESHIGPHCVTHSGTRSYIHLRIRRPFDRRLPRVQFEG